LVRSVPGWTTLGKGKKDKLRNWIKRELSATIANQKDLFGKRAEGEDEDRETQSTMGVDPSDRSRAEELLASDAPDSDVRSELLNMGFSWDEVTRMVEGR
jgi:hypothetical protein